MRDLLISLSFTFLLCSCTTESSMEQAEAPDSTAFKYHETAHKPAAPADSTGNPFQGKEFKAEAYQNGESGWGYFISIDGQKTINQPTIPGLPGKNGFKTKEQALKTADLVIYKIQHGSFPPSVSKKELDSLGVLK